MSIEFHLPGETKGETKRWEIIGGWTVPVWLSVVGVVVASYLAYAGFKLQK